MTSNRKYRDEDWLREQYVGKQQSSLEIAEICECHPSTIQKWLNKHNIKTRSGCPLADKRLTDADWLRKEYVEKEHTTTKIADECDCSKDTVWNWLEKHDIESRSRLADKRLKDAEWLRKQYIELGKSMKDIGEECGCSRSVIRKWLHRHNIESRVASPPADSRLADESWMKAQYVEKGQSTGEIANVCDCSHSVVLDWMEKHGIETRDPKEALPTGNDHPRWTGGEYSYGPGWSIGKKRKVRERDDYICQDARCSVTQADHLDQYGQKLHVHHLRKAKEVDDPEERNAKENLITLCRDCHRRWEKIADAGLVPQLARDTAN